MGYPILVTCAIIKKGKKFLITQRPENSHNGGRWEFPGGKLEFGEDARECLKREIKEELGISVVPREILEYSSHVYNNDKHIILLAFICEYKSGKIQKIHINDFVWVTPREMKEYDMTEADLPFVKKLK